MHNVDALRGNTVLVNEGKCGFIQISPQLVIQLREYCLPSNIAVCSNTHSEPSASGMSATAVNKGLADDGVTLDCDALAEAAYKGDVVTVNVLLDKGVCVNAKNRNGVTALYCASWGGHIGVCQQLVTKDAHLKQDDLTLLGAAAFKGHTGIVEWLLEAGADINATNKEDVTALYYACLSGHHLVATILLARGADKERGSYQPLGAASIGGHTKLVSLLLDNNADVNSLNKEGVTALYSACWSGDTAVSQTLISAGADVNKGDLKPLGAAAFKGHCDVIDLLLNEGADVDAADVRGVTPLYAACQERHVEVVKKLTRSSTEAAEHMGMAEVKLPLEKGATTDGKNEACRIALQLVRTLKIHSEYASDEYRTLDTIEELLKSECPELGLDVQPVNMQDKDTRKWITFKDNYPMRCPTRGRALIINNIQFCNGTRRGADLDSVNICHLFKQLHFETDPDYKDRTAEEIRNIILEESKHPSHEDANCLVVCVMSHGTEGYLYGIDDERVHIEDEIITPFDGDNCSSLVNKPKLFFFQVCRKGISTKCGKDERRKADVQPDAVVSSGPRTGIDQDTPSVLGNHKQADILIAYATVPGYLSWRNPKLGSCFVRTVVDVFTEWAHRETVLDMLGKVRKKLLKLNEKLGIEYIQLSKTDDTTTKKLYFLPGYQDTASR